jgi:hypothetical protein
MKSPTAKYRRDYLKCNPQERLAKLDWNKVIERACLNCERVFETDQKNIRVCQPCKDASVWRSSN